MRESREEFEDIRNSGGNGERLDDSSGSCGEQGTAQLRDEILKRARLECFSQATEVT